MAGGSACKFSETMLNELLSEVNISKRLEAIHFVSQRPLMDGRRHCEKIMMPHNKALQPTQKLRG